jgi:hypothetical protein
VYFFVERVVSVDNVVCSLAPNTISYGLDSVVVPVSFPSIDYEAIVESSSILIIAKSPLMNNDA